MENETTGTEMTIVLASHSPVIITKADWPRIAAYESDSVDEAGKFPCLVVRQHKNGRAIVYGGNGDWEGGMLVEAGNDIPAAIHSVGCDSLMDVDVIRQCVATLPAERI